jgi:hypothetical protein
MKGLLRDLRCCSCLLLPPPLLRVYSGAIKGILRAILRAYQGPFKGPSLLQLPAVAAAAAAFPTAYLGSIKGLLRLYSGAIKGLLRL